jgi:hypothetical protein
MVSHRTRRFRARRVLRVGERLSRRLDPRDDPSCNCPVFQASLPSAFFISPVPIPKILSRAIALTSLASRLQMILLPI